MREIEGPNGAEGYQGLLGRRVPAEHEHAAIREKDRLVACDICGTVRRGEGGEGGTVGVKDVVLRERTARVVCLFPANDPHLSLRRYCRMIHPAHRLICPPLCLVVPRRVLRA